MARRRTHFATPCLDVLLSGADIPREPSTVHPVQHRFTLRAHGRTLCEREPTRGAFRLIRRRRAHPRVERRSRHHATRPIPSRHQLTRKDVRFTLDIGRRTIGHDGLTLTLRRRTPANNCLTGLLRRPTPSTRRLTLDRSVRTSDRHERTRTPRRLTHRS